MPDWEGLEEFSMVAQTESFTAAAQRLNVSTSHVSRQVQALEDRLGVKLLARTTRKVRLTDLGADYLARVDELMANLDAVNQSIAGDFADLKGLLRVSAAGPFAETVVMPKLLEFVSRNEGVTLEADFNNRNVDLIAEGYDFALRYGQLTNSSLVARKLATHRLACVASEAYLAQHGVPSHPSDLRHHSCLISNNDTWVFCDPANGKNIRVKVKGRVRTNSIPIMLEAADKGFGIAYSPVENLKPLLDTGRVRRILDGFEDHSRSHWIVYPDRRLMPRHVRAAINYLLDSMAANRM
ncbi:LysR family transcriptional regulator [uncultured Tateyamaria sp.]|uniref:LysR family transcriptional regulator n=1 Tax=uncultured Tateyamaria sp. TaxID=455651 RepID=UPI002604F38F|nr:LysR family transcriptional regulator [uncultured Tateyamaria sp.]